MTRPLACCVIHDIGFYHHARMQAAAALGPCTVLEIHGRSAYPEFKYDPGTDAGYAVVPMAGDVPQTLDRIRPGVVFLPGWSDRNALAGLRWGLRTGTPAVVLSESTRADADPDERRPGGGRQWWREATKRRIVPLYSAALVGGTPHRAYAIELGMPAERVFDGYDIVDNDHFAKEADAARRDAAALRVKHNLPERFFFASARFIPKKNLPRLIQAFAAYRASAGPAAWDLVLLGDGPEKPEILRLTNELKIAAAVHLPGFKPLADLPIYYGLAGALVHASTTEQWGLVVNEAMAAGLPVVVSRTCGCVPDLLTNGVSGLTFDPTDTAELTRMLLAVAAPDFARPAMGQAARARVSEWGPSRFGAHFWEAAEAALRLGPCRAGLVGRMLVSALSA